MVRHLGLLALKPKRSQTHQHGYTHPDNSLKISEATQARRRELLKDRNRWSLIKL